MQNDELRSAWGPVSGFLLHPYEVEDRIDALDDDELKELSDYLDEATDSVDYALHIVAWLRARE